MHCLTQIVKKRIWLIGAPIMAFLVLVFIFMSISPDEVAPGLLLLIFALQYLVIFALFNLGYLFFSKLRAVFFLNLPLQQGLGQRKKTQLMAFLSLMPIIALAIQSIKPLGLYELILISVLILVGVTVIYKR